MSSLIYSVRISIVTFDCIYQSNFTIGIQLKLIICLPCLTKNRKTREISSHEHGPRRGDEINIIAANKNYGWPMISYGINYYSTSYPDLTKKEGMEYLIYYWAASIVHKDIRRVRNVVQLTDGFIYVATDNDAIYRLKS